MKNSATICFCKNVSQFFQECSWDQNSFKNMSHIVQKSKWVENSLKSWQEFWFKKQWGGLLYVILVISGLSLPRFCLAFIVWEFLLKISQKLRSHFCGVLRQNLIKVQHKMRRTIGFHSEMCQCVKPITTQSSSTELCCDWSASEWRPNLT